MNIFIAGHYNLNNGDRAVLEATLKVLDEECPDARIVVSAYAPEKIKAEGRYKCIGWPIKDSTNMSRLYQSLCKFIDPHIAGRIVASFLKKNYVEELKKADIVLFSGGHHFTDILGKSTYFKLLSNLIFPIMYNKKVILLPQSIGPTNDKRILNINSRTLNKVNYIAFRDSSSKGYIEENHISAPASYVPDIVYCLPALHKKHNMPDDTLRVGVALYCNYPAAKKQLFDYVACELIKTLQLLIDKRNARISIIPMEIKGTKSDDRVFASRIIDGVDAKFRENITICEAESDKITDTVSLFGENDIILAFKTHSVVFSAISHVPLIAIAYHPKSIEFMNEMSLAEYAINDKDIEAERLYMMIDEALNNSETIVSKEIKAVSKNIKDIRDFIKTVVN